MTTINTRHPSPHRARGAFWSLLLCSWLLLAGCGENPDSEASPGVSSDVIVLGSSSALHGHAGFLGSQYTLGSRAWFNEVNAAGGIHGRRIELLAYDDGYEPERTVANTDKLIKSDRVFMLFDYVGTPTSVRIISLVHEYEIPSFGFLTGAEGLRTPYRPNMFHLRASYYAEVEGAIDYFVEHLGFDRIAVMYQNDAFGLAVLTGVQLSMRKRQLEIIATDTYERGSMDLARPVDTVSRSGAQAVIMAGTYQPLARFIKDMHLNGADPYFHTVSFVGSAAFSEAIREQAVEPGEYERIIVTQVVPSPFSDDLEAVSDYQRDLDKHFPDESPNYVSLEGYLNAKLLTIALERTGPTLNRARIVEAFEGLHDLDIGIRKSISFAPFDHNGLDGIYFSRLNPDGSFRVFDPLEIESQGH